MVGRWLCGGNRQSILDERTVLTLGRHRAYARLTAKHGNATMQRVIGGWKAPAHELSNEPARPPRQGAATIPVGAMFGLLSMPHVDAVLSIALVVLLVGIVAALAVAFWREVRHDTVFLEPIEVPKDLAERGYHPAVIANLLLDEARKIQRGASGIRQRRALEHVAALADLSLPGGNLSIRAIVRYVRALFGRPAVSINGAVLRKTDGYVLLLRRGSRVIEPVGGPHAPSSSVDALLHVGAQDLLQAVDPFSLATWYQQGPEATSADYPNTIRLLDQVVRTGTAEDRAWALGLWGTVLVRQGRADESTLKYRASLAAHDPVAMPMALANMALNLAQRGQEKEALAEIAAVENRRPPKAQNLLVCTTAYGFLARWTQALKLAQRAVRMEPRNAHAHVQLGFVLAGLHRYDEAVAALQRARKLGEDDNWLEFGLAYHLARAGRIDEALEAGRAAVTRVPDGFHQRMALGFAELYAGRYAKAAADFERAERVFSHYEVLKAGWGDALIALDRPLEALAKYEDAIFENKRLGEAWRGMGVALTRLGRAEEALAKFEQAVAVDPNDPATYRAWADTLAGLGEHLEAEAKRKRGDDLARLNTASPSRAASSATA